MKNGNHSWNGSHYHAHSSMQESAAKTTLNGITLQGRILDIGCGSGSITADIASHVTGNVLGIDSSPSMIAFAQENFKHIPNLSFEIIDATNWPFAKEEFDYIVSFSCLHWIKDLQPVIDNITLSLKESGLFAACLAPPNHFLYKPLMEVANSSRWAPYFENPQQKPWCGYDPNSFQKLLEHAQLKPLAIEVWDKKTSSKSRDDFIAFLKGWIMAVPHVIQLPVKLQNPFIENVADHFLISVPLADDGSFEYITPYLLVKASKEVE